MNKNYGLNGVAQDLELGKNGLWVKTSNGYYELMLADGTTLSKVKVADGVDASDAVNKSQLDLKLDITKVVTDINAIAGNVPDAPTVLTAINTAISDLVDGAPDALNTLNELAAALNDDEVFSTTVTNLITANSTKIGNLETLSGVASGSTELGTFTNSIITDNGTVKAGMEELGTAVDNLSSINHMGSRKVPFTFESGATFNIEGEIPTGSYVTDVKVKIVTPFNDIAATLNIGEAGNINHFMDASLIDIYKAGVYVEQEFEVLASATQAIGTLDAGTSTQGDGYILISYC